MSGKDVGSKTGGGALKWFAAGALILLFILSGLSLLTSPTRSIVSSCANKYGVSSDTVIYAYTPKCCEKTVSHIIEQASKARGYKYKYVAADTPDKSSEGLLKCYLPPGYISVPQLICPANGNTRILTSPGTFDQIITFT